LERVALATSNLRRRKSHLAHHFIDSFLTTDKPKERKHTFWIHASSRGNFQASMLKAVKQTHINISNNYNVALLLKVWLADKDNGPWIMVIDGLDDDKLAKEVARALPEDCGQVLITTNHRAILEHFPGLNRNNVFHVGDLKLEDNRKIFVTHAWNAIIPEDGSELDDLLRYLHLPLLVKFVAEYITTNPQPLSAIHKNLQPGKSKHLEERIYRIFNRILSPLLTQSSRQPSDVLRLLGELSCLEKEGFAYDLIETGYADPGKLREMLGRLQNDSFIGHDGNDNYFMLETIQRAVRDVMKKRFGLEFILKLHESTLCMLYVLYDKQRHDRKKKQKDQKMRRSSYIWKLPFMPHFERFLEFSKDHGAKEFDKVEFSGRTVEAVATFAQVYLDEGRYNDALCVLELTRKLYRGTKHRHHLDSHLLHAYHLRLGAHEDKESVDKVKELIEDILKTTEDEKTTDRTWRLLFDLAKLDCRLREPEKAFERLERCSRQMRLFIKNNRPRIHGSRGMEMGKTEKRQLVILLHVEEARAYRTHAKMAKASEKACSRIAHLQNAETRLYEAKKAIQQWFPDENEWTMEIDEEIAEVLKTRGSFKDLETAENLLKTRLDWIVSHGESIKHPLSQKGRCDLRCKIARLRLRKGNEIGKEHLRKEAIDILKTVLEYYEKWYGKKDGHTQRCARWLSEALITDGQTDAARRLEKTMGLRGTKMRSWSIQKKPSRTNRKFMSLVGCFFLVCLTIFAMVRWMGEYFTWRML
jgi:hypothetical protein